jgi:hypothetical protein
MSFNKKFVAITAGVILFLGLQCVEAWQILSLRNQIKQTKWVQMCILYVDRFQNDAITPEVGTIQFLRHGYSIELQNVNYTGEGLKLNGFVGNPTNLFLSNLTLKLTATKPLAQYQDAFLKDEHSFDYGPQPIGESQTSPIAFLKPQSRQPFEVTIPNVKQTKDGVRIEVAFTGERYPYQF